MESVVGAWVDRDAISWRGVDAAPFLQGQLSQDLIALEPGTSAWSLLLTPQGKVDSFLRVSRLAADHFVLDVATGGGPAMMARLERFKLRVACEAEPISGWRCLSLRSAVGDSRLVDTIDTSSATIGADPMWPGLDGVDLLGPDVVAPDGFVDDPDGLEVLRIRSGVPASGSELDGSTIPAEAGRWLIEHAVSFTKGCYVGQELVARVDSRGSNTPRKLRVVRLDSSGPGPGAPILLDGAEVGGLTSVVGLDALGYLRRSVEPGAAVSIDGILATVSELPVS